MHSRHCQQGRHCPHCQAATRAVYAVLWRGLCKYGIEACAATAGLAGAWLLATKGSHAAWGWWFYLASNVAWMIFATRRRHWFLLLQQAGFTASSLWGIWAWTS